MASESVLDVLRGVRALVGEVAFNAAVAQLNGGAASTVPTAAAAKPVKERKKRTLDAEAAEKARRNMATMQAYYQEVRKEMPEMPYKEMLKVAGGRWKALSAEEKEAWATAAADGAKTVQVTAAAGSKAVAEQVTVTKDAAAAEAPKKGRGRPKKAETAADADAE